MSKRMPAESGRRMARGGPAGKSPTDDDAIRGTTAAGFLVFPPRRLRTSRPASKSGSSGPGKGSRPGK